MTTKKTTKKFEIEASKLPEFEIDTKEKARDTRDYEVMLMDFIRKEVTGGV